MTMLKRSQRARKPKSFRILTPGDGRRRPFTVTTTLPNGLGVTSTRTYQAHSTADASRQAIAAMQIEFRLPTRSTVHVVNVKEG